MNGDDLDSVDQHSNPPDEGSEKHSRRGRLKDAISRTKTQIQHRVHEEREKRKDKKPQSPHEPQLDNDVNDFLAAGRPSFASSQRPSFGSAQRPSLDDSSASPRPSTSDSKSQASPRRGPPIAVPRIDVSSSTRFPNARTVNPDDVLLEHPIASPFGSGSLPNNSLLRPEYRDRSQSASCLATGKRRARARGLSVGFANAPPTIIGEGGEEAQAPVVEISRAKARARSASPQGRKPYNNAAALPEARKPGPGRYYSADDGDPFVPKPFARTQTGASVDSTSSGRPLASPQGEFVPKPFARQRTGFSDTSSTSSTTQGRPIPQKPPTNPLLYNLAPVDTGKMDLNKEFEMTLALTSPGGGAATNQGLVNNQPSTIVAPKPKRAPPSYDLIEGVGKDQPDFADRKFSPEQVPAHVPTKPAIPQQRPSQDQVTRRPVPSPQGPVHLATQPQTQNPPRTSPQQQALTHLQSPPKEQQRRSPSRYTEDPQQPTTQSSAQEYYPPPPQRQPTQVIRNIQNLDPIQPHHGKYVISNTRVPKEQEAVAPQDNRPDSRSFAERQRNANASDMSEITRYPSLQETGTIRRVTDEDWEASPSDYAGSIDNTPITATGSTPTRMRYYESMNKGNAPEGFI